MLWDLILPQTVRAMRTIFMEIYKPKFSLGTLSDPQSELKSKFGGSPWGFPKEKWPSADLVLLAQLVHDPPMIDLGGDFVLHLWHWAAPDSFMDPPNYAQGSVFSTLLKRDVSVTNILTTILR